MAKPRSWNTFKNAPISSLIWCCTHSIMFFKQTLLTLELWRAPTVYVNHLFIMLMTRVSVSWQTLLIDNSVTVIVLCKSMSFTFIWIFIKINNFFKLPDPGIKPLILGLQGQRSIPFSIEESHSIMLYSWVRNSTTHRTHDSW